MSLKRLRKMPALTAVFARSAAKREMVTWQCDRFALDQLRAGGCRHWLRKPSKRERRETRYRDACTRRLVHMLRCPHQ